MTYVNDKLLTLFAHYIEKQEVLSKLTESENYLEEKIMETGGTEDAN